MSDFKCNYCDYGHVNISKEMYYLARLYMLNHVSEKHPEHELGMGDGFTTKEGEQ